jgi:hypothetical protein
MDDVREPRLWRRDGWTARVIGNEDGDGGWAVEMTRAGDPEPALVGPWTMGRDKKNPKPLDQAAFTTLVKTASEVIARHEQQAKAAIHSHFVYVRTDGQRVAADLDVAGDDDDPHAILACADDITGEPLRTGRVPLGYRLNAASIERFLAGDLG